ncbi:MAG: GatB/YqeY domain-containing protein [Gammaproteobacteria bacterium]|nr:GatB/YqeY domain-containing protein [Gammaproteobacteria bacterium]
MSDSLKTRLQEDVKNAMRAKDKDRLGTLRLITAAIKQREVDERIELNDEQVLSVLEKMVKQRREAISQYESAGRTDLADKEASEIAIIGEFLPEPASDAEIDQAISEAIAATGANGIKDMGKVMGILQTKLKGRADMGAISGKVRSKLA